VTGPVAVDLLHERAEQFAQDLSRMVRGVLGDHVSEFLARWPSDEPEDGPAEATHLVVRQADTAGITLTIDGVPAMQLQASYRYIWDHQGTYLAVRDSYIKVRSCGQKEPLFHVEYLHDPASGVPAAHLQVHAHRDEFTFHLLQGGQGRRPARRAKALTGNGGIPRLCDLHFPLGGHRFRPCVEDILEMLVEEFGIDRQADYLEHLTEGRARWRRDQTATSARDCPEEAVRALEELGYTMVEPEGGRPAERTDRLTAY